MRESFEEMLTGGHPNSLGNTVELVEMVLKDKSKLDDLYQCYFSQDEVVRLRVSSAMKRICIARPEWLVPYLDKLLSDIASIDQASTQWTLALLFLCLEKDMSKAQKAKAMSIMQRNLDENDDWIVQNTTMETLGIWAANDEELKAWLIPRLEKFTQSPRKSVAGRARKILTRLQ